MSFFFLVEEEGGRREGERWKDSVHLVGNFYEPTVRHITFKRLKSWTPCSLFSAFSVFVGEKKRE